MREGAFDPSMERRCQLRQAPSSSSQLPDGWGGEPPWSHDRFSRQSQDHDGA